MVSEKTFAIQAISYIKIPADIENARKHSRMLPDSRNSRNFSPADDSRYTVIIDVPAVSCTPKQIDLQAYFVTTAALLCQFVVVNKQM